MIGQAWKASEAFSLEGKRAFVTGGGRGIGLSLATALGYAGAELYLFDRNEADALQSAAGLRDLGLRATGIVLDITDRDQVSATLASLPAADILVNNAGTNRPKPLSEVTAEDYDLVVGLNLNALIWVTKAVTDRMVAEGIRGSVINISSQMGHVGAVNRTLYCASKHGVEGFTKSLAVELAPQGVRVNSIAPTFIETDMTRSFFEDESFKAEVLSKIKLGRMGRPEDLNGGLLLLASNAGAMITGTSLVIDGGWTAE